MMGWDGDGDGGRCSSLTADCSSPYLYWPQLAQLLFT